MFVSATVKLYPIAQQLLGRSPKSLALKLGGKVLTSIFGCSDVFVRHLLPSQSAGKALQTPGFATTVLKPRFALIHVLEPESDLDTTILSKPGCSRGTP